MTVKEEILTMEAGEELDGLVATKVMEEPMPEFTPPNALDLQLVGSPIKSPKGSWLSRCKYEEGDIPIWHPLPFSKDISAAWEAMEKVISDGNGWDFAYHLCELIHIEEYCTTDVVEKLLTVLTPEAICKAALLTKVEEAIK